MNEVIKNDLVYFSSYLVGYKAGESMIDWKENKILFW